MKKQPTNLFLFFISESHGCSPNLLRCFNHRWQPPSPLSVRLNKNIYNISLHIPVRSCRMKMSCAGFLVLVFVLLVTCSEAEQATEFAEASDGGTAQLPCNLVPAHAPDKISVVLWYKGADESPMYKYDLRGSQPQHWADPSYGNRYYLRVLDDQKAVLTISPTKQTDEATFHCRVDFQKSPTKITHVNLTVIGEYLLFV